MLKSMKSMTAALLGLGMALSVSGAADAQEKRVLKMQATWPASLTLYENFQMWAERVDKLSGGRSRSRRMPAGQVVPAFEVLDATHKKVIDGAHTWRRLLDRQEQDVDPVHRRPRRHVRHGHIDYMGWMYDGGGLELLQRVLPEGAQAQRRRVPDPALGPAGVRLVQEADQEPRATSRA